MVEEERNSWLVSERKREPGEVRRKVLARIEGLNERVWGRESSSASLPSVRPIDTRSE